MAVNSPFLLKIYANPQGFYVIHRKSDRLLVQESLNNVIRHANASHVTVGLKCRAGWLDLAISDDGCGFDQHALKTRSPNYFPLGLLGMRERAAGLNGSLTIDSTPGAGTTVRARFPLEPA